jgi:beta-lactamase regulating signal transducer with metallopeptidase domain
MDTSFWFLDAHADKWALWMVHMSWQVALLGGLIWLVARSRKRSAAGLRYALWMLVFVKLILPPGLATPWSAGTVVARVMPPVVRTLTVPTHGTEPLNAPIPAPAAMEAAYEPRPAVDASRTRLWPVSLLMLAWGGVALGALAVLLAQYVGYARRVTRRLAFAPESVQRVFTAQLEALRMPNTILLRVSPDVERPGVFGSWHPMVLLPEGFEARFPAGALAGVLAHELAHIKRRDLLAGWVFAAIGCLYWFHPVVWVAMLNLRREREMACDDIVLESTRQESRDYAATIVDVAESLGGALPAGAGFLGVVELASSLSHRVRSVVDSTRSRRPGWSTAAWIAVIALLFLPMGVWSKPVGAEDGAVGANDSQPKKPPRVVMSVPKAGAIDVDPDLKEIRVTFDQDMDSRGYAWTGGGEVFPKKSGEPYWLDRRTCAMPVSLEKGRFYRVGVNSSSYKDFAARAGEPALPDVVFFTAKGADKKTLERLKSPKVVSLSPENGAKGVAPGTVEIAVTFDMPMDPGYSWVGQGPNLPEFVGDPTWSEDRRTCSLTAQLKPNWYFSFGLNSSHHINFQSASGVPLTPVTWDFHTGD